MFIIMDMSPQVHGWYYVPDIHSSLTSRFNIITGHATPIYLHLLYSQRKVNETSNDIYRSKAH